MGKRPGYVRKTLHHTRTFGEKNGRKKRKQAREIERAFQQDVADVCELVDILLLLDVVEALDNDIDLLVELLSEEGD